MQVAHEHGIPVPIFLSLVRHESGWNPNARSPVGAYGLTQLMPATARGLGVNLNDPRSQLEGGARYLSQQYKQFGNWRDALAAYNAGPGAVTSGKWRSYPETTAYVRGILGDARGAGGLSSGDVSAVSHSGTPSVPGVSSPDLSNVPLFGLQHHMSPGQELSALATESQGKQPDIPGLPPMRVNKTPGIPAIPGVEVRIQGNASSRDKGAIALAREFLGTPYVWGGESPGGFDCSGLLQYVWAKMGVSIPRTTYDQWQAGHAVSVNALRPGDAVFFRGSDARGNLPGHVGLYIGGGRFIEAPHTGAVVQISNLRGRTDFVGARRYG